jgi:hypothetical protein
MNRRLFPLLFLMVWTAAALAQFGSAASSQPGVKLRGRSFAELYAAQKVLLSNFCRLDFEGARLEPAGWNRLKPYTSLRNNPEFTRVIVVTRFNIETPEQPSEELSASYQTVGYYQEGEGYTPASSNDQVIFRVQEQNDNLLVTEFHPEAPHVSPRAALAWMALRLADPKTSELERTLLNDAVRQLNRSLPQPRPATNPTGP